MMRARLGASVFTLVLAAGCAAEAPPPASSSSSAATVRTAASTARYTLVRLPSPAGGASAGNSIDDFGRIAGTSNLPGDGVMHAASWSFGRARDLGTLGGPNSAVVWPVKNVRGLVSGIAETDALDPLGESWSCSAFFPSQTGHVCRGFVWRDGVMHALPTLGGTNGFATGTNNLGVTVGWAENSVHDATCNAPQVLQFRAVAWSADGTPHELAPLPGDTTSAATGLNDRGQVIGISGICSNAVGGLSAAHAVLWENGRPRDLGTLGGVAWNTPMALNERGDVVGFANLPTDPPTKFNAHAFAWSRAGGIRDLGTLPGDTHSQALGLNERGDVVGLSCGAGGCRSVLWQDGVAGDLATLVDAEGGPPPALAYAGDIDDLGVITGQTADGAAFVAIPR